MTIRMMFLPSMRGISEIRLSEQITGMLKTVFMKICLFWKHS